MKTYRLGVIAGDGIGPEVTAAALRVLEALEKRFGFRTERTSFPWSGAHYLRTGERLTPDKMAPIREQDAVLLGAIGHPDAPRGLIERDVIIGLRRGLDLYVNLRPIKNYPNVASRYTHVDLLIFRENSEDLYVGNERMVDPDTAESLVKDMETIEIRKGEVIFNEGEPGDSLYIILSGKIKLGRRAADGRQNLVMVMGPSDMVGELSLFDPGPRTATATAVTDARLARLRKQSLRPWLTNRPEISEQLLRVLARRLRRTNDALADLIFTDVPGRVAKNLLQMAGKFGSREGGVLRVTHDLTQEELAQLVGASRETVNKALADFASRGWLRLDGKSVIILDPERLARRARV